MSDLKIQGVVEMSSEGAERSFDRVGQKAEEMSRKVTQTSAQAGQAVDQIGTGANRNADEFTRSEKRIVDSIKRATTELQNLGKTASQKLELRIDARGLERAKFEPLLANLRELEAAQTRVAASGRGFGGQLQNTSYQLQDFIVQVNGGTDATRALAMQLPQMLVGFGAAGAAIGVVAALLPNLVTLFGNTADEAASLKDAMSGMDDAISQVGRTVRTFDMEGLYEEFNAASEATRAATIEQLNFQRTFIETQRLVSQKAFSESLTGIGDYGFLDKLSGGGNAATRIADDLGVTLEVAQQLEPVLKGLRDGTEDVGAAFTQFGTKLLSGNKAAVDLATAMRDLANGEKDAYAASSALSEALERMAKGHVTTKKEADEAAKSSKAYADEMARLAQAGNDLVRSLLGQSTGLTSDFYKKWDLLGKAYKAGAISLQELTTAQAALLAQQPAMKQAAKDAEEYGKALGASVGALEDRALAVEQELATYGLTKSQIERTTVARLEEVRAMAQADGASDEYLRNLDREIVARKRIAEATASIEVEDANKKAAEKAAQEWERTANAIEDKLIDALMEGGKSGKEYIEGLFRTMVLRPIVQAIVQPVAGGITSALGLGSSAQGGSPSFSLPGGAGWLSSGLQLAGNAIGSAGLTSFGAGMGMTSTQIAGLSQAGLINGAAAGAGSFVASALPWVGGALAIANALGAFKGPTYHSGSAIYTGTDDVSQKLGHKAPVPGMAGGVWGGFTETDAKGGAAYTEALSSLGKAMTDSYEQTLKAFGIAAEAAAYTAFGADGKDKSEGNFRLYDESGNTLAMNYAGRDGKHYAKDAATGLQQFAEDAALVTSRAIVTKLRETDLEDAIDAIFDAVDPAKASIEQLNAAIQAAQAWAAQGEQLRAAISEMFDAPMVRLQAQFDSLGLSIPETAQAYEALVRAQDLSAASGREMAFALIGAKQLWDEVSQAAADAAGRAAEESARRVSSAESALRAAYNRESSELRQTISQFDAFSRSLRDFRQQLLIGDQSPLSLPGREAEVGRQFEKIAARARLGDVEAIEQLQSISTAYLDASRESAASAEDYYRDFARVQAALEGAESVAKRQADAAQRQLDALTQQVSALISIDEGVMSVADAIAALTQEMRAMTGAILSALSAGALSAQDALAQIEASGGALGRDQWASVQTASGAASVWASSGGALGVKEGKTTSIYGKDGSKFSDFDAVDFVGKALAAGDEKAVYDAAKRTGISASSLDALMGWSAGTSNAWAELNKLPKFAAGGYHPGGLRIVGEQGPELEVTGPARIYSADQTRAMLGGGNEEMVRELRALRAELAELKAASAATARSTNDTQRILSRVTNGGNAMLTEAAA